MLFQKPLNSLGPKYRWNYVWTLSFRHFFLKKYNRPKVPSILELRWNFCIGLLIVGRYDVLYRADTLVALNAVMCLNN